MAVFTRYAADIITLSQIIASNPRALYPSNILSFTQEARPGLLYLDASNFIFFNHGPELQFGIYQVSVSSTLNLIHKPNKVIDVEIFQNFFPYQLPPPRFVEYELIEHDIDFVQLLIGINGKPADDELELEQSVIANIVKNITVIETLDMESNGLGYMLDPKFIGIDIPEDTPTGGNNGRCEE